MLFIFRHYIVSMHFNSIKDFVNAVNESRFINKVLRRYCLDNTKR